MSARIDDEEEDHSPGEHGDEVVLGVFKPPQGFGMFVKKSSKKPGFKVMKVERPSYASNIGLREGDLIVAIDGERIAGFKLQKVLELLKSDDLNTITVRHSAAHQGSAAAGGMQFSAASYLGAASDFSALDSKDSLA